MNSPNLEIFKVLREDSSIMARKLHVFVILIPIETNLHFFFSQKPHPYSSDTTMTSYT